MMNKKKAGLMVVLVMIFCLAMSMSVFAAENGWVKKSGDTYYYQNGQMKKGWLRLNGKRYYFLKGSGKMITASRYKIGKKTYYFDKNGVMVKTIKNAHWVLNRKGRRYYDDDNTYLKNRWAVIQGKYYRFNKKGYAVKGWNKVRGNWYYFDKKGVMASKKLIKTGGSLYYVGEDGKRVSNTWVGRRYFGDDGKRIKQYVDQTRTSKSKTGWVGYGKLWKFYKNGKVVVGWRNIQGNRYYFQPDGYLRVGWFNYNGFYYFLNTDKDHIGVMHTGWIRINGKEYFFFKSATKVGGTTYPRGSMARGMGLRDARTGKVYNFDRNGVCTNYNK